VAKGGPGKLDIVIGAHLRRLRASARLSEAQVAAILNVSQQLISDQENGRKRVSIAQLLRLAALYGRSLAQLIAEMELDHPRSAHFGEAEQMAYRAETTVERGRKGAREPFWIDLNEFDDPAERDALFDRFNRLKQKQGGARR